MRMGDTFLFSKYWATCLLANGVTLNIESLLFRLQFFQKIILLELCLHRMAAKVRHSLHAVASNILPDASLVSA